MDHPAAPPHARRHLLRALRHRNYRLYFAGQSISWIGSWMQRIAMGWLVYRLTHSAFMLGLVDFCGQIPILLLTPLAGALTDRSSRYRILLATQSLALLQAALLALLALAGRIEVWQIIALSSFLGIVNAFDLPARHAFVIDIVDDRRDLGNAIALNSSVVNAARLIGPTLGGLLIAATSEGVCFLVNAASYLAIVVALLAMRLTPRRITPSATSLLRGLREGIAYAYAVRPIRAMLLLLALLSLMGMPYAVLMPVIAAQIFHGGPHVLGFLMGASGVGALVGTLVLARRQSAAGLERVIALSAGLFGAAIVAVAFSRSLPLSMALIALAGFGMIGALAATNTMLQVIVHDDKRGRLMSLYAVAFLGVAPFGSLLAGSTAHRFGVPVTLLVGGIACIAGSLAFASRLSVFRGAIRPAFIPEAVGPEVETGG